MIPDDDVDLVDGLTSVWSYFNVWETTDASYDGELPIAASDEVYYSV